MIPIKNIPNVLTCLRIFVAVIMVFTEPFSVVFWILYICGGLSDVFDGFIARQFNAMSGLGAKLDSIADLVFGLAIGLVLLRSISMPKWALVCVVLIVLVRVIGYGIGWHKYHEFSSLHTYANKATGALIFLSPLLYVLLGLNITIIILCVIAFVSSVEELVITIQAAELCRDRKFLMKK